MNTKPKFLRDEVANIILTDESLKDYVVSIISASTNIKKEDIEDIKLFSPRINTNTNTKISYVDAIYENNENIINIEVNVNDNEFSKAKNMRYIYQLVLRQVKSGEKDIYKKVWQINLNDFDFFHRNEFVYRSYIMEENNHLKRSDEIEIIDINLELLRTMGYNKIKEEEDNSLEKLLYVFMCSEKEKREELYEGNEVMEKVNDKLEELTDDFDNILFYDLEEFRKQESEFIGREEARKEIAQNLLKMKMSIKDIAKATGLKIEEIEKLQEDR